MTYFNSLQTPRLSLVGPVSSSAYKWGAHAPGVRLFEANTSAKFIGTAAAAALGTAPFVIGTNTATWEIRINITGTILIGIATATRDLNSVAPGLDALFREIATAEGTIVSVTLSTTAMTITATAPAASAATLAPTTTTTSLAPYAALTMYPFAAAAGTFAASFAITSGAAFTVNAASELTITTAATPINFNTGGAGLLIDGKAATPEALPLTGGDMIGDINFINPATITGLSYLSLNNVDIGSIPRRILFTFGSGLIQAGDNIVNAIRIESTSAPFMRFDSTIGTAATNILTPLLMNTQPIIAVAPSTTAGSFYETVAAAAYALSGSIVLVATNITLKAARVGGIVTIDWTTAGPFTSGPASIISVPTFVLPLSMRPAANKTSATLVTYNGLLTIGYITVLTTGSIEFRPSPPTATFIAALTTGITSGSASWTV